MKKIFIYGTGACAKYILETHFFIDEEIVGAVETKKTVEEWEGYKVYSLVEIITRGFDEIWLSNRHIETLNACLELGIDKNRLVIYNEKLFEEYTNNRILDIKYNRIEAEAYEEYVFSKSARILTTTVDLYQNVYYTKFSKSENILINEDYCRYATMMLLSREIKRYNIEGDVAELGVYRGTFARCINREFPERTLHLFDTFEGFNEDDIQIEIEEEYTPEDFISMEDFSRTGVDKVIKSMRFPDKVVVHKGYFPETIPSYDVKYAFVSLDCDLYKPALEGLRYFYPRLSKGGYMMIHDYNHQDIWLGIRKAIDEFENDMGRIFKVPITDNCGTLIVGK